MLRVVQFLASYFASLVRDYCVVSRSRVYRDDRMVPFPVFLAGEVRCVRDFLGVATLRVVKNHPSTRAFLVLVNAKANVSMVSGAAMVSMTTVTVLKAASMLALFRSLLMDLLRFFRFFFNLVLVQVVSVNVQIVLSTRLPMYLFCFVVEYISKGSRRTM